MTHEECPKAPILVHAAFAVLAINTSIALLFCVSPNTGRTSGLKQEPQSDQFLAQKGSPFEAVAIQTPRKGFRLPRKLEPIVAQTIPEATIPSSGSDN